MPSEQRQKHIPALDGLRGFAFLMVFLLHTLTLPSNQGSAFAAQLVGLGRFGVDLFFCLSGFLITGILYSTKNDRDYFKLFYIRRSLRIAPLYYLYLTAFSLLVVHTHVTAFGAYSLREVAQATRWAWFYGINLLVAKRGGWVVSPLNHFWSLAVEEHFYLVWPVIVFRANRRNLIKMTGSICFASFLLRVALAYHGTSIEVIESFTPCRIDSFAIGGGASLLLSSPNWRAWLTKLAPIALGPALVIFLLTYFISATLWTTVGLTSLSVFFTCIIVCAVEYDHSRWISLLASAPMRFLGKYSYSLYIFHFPIQLYISHKYPIAHTTQTLHSLFLALVFRMIIVGLLSIGVALLTWNLIEHPALKLKRHFSPSHERKDGSGMLTTRLEPSN